MKKLEESIENIESKVQSLFQSTDNDELSEDINDELISEIKVLLGHVQDKEMNEELSARYEAARENYDQAVLMYDMLKEIDSIFDEEGLVLVEADIKDLKVKLGESPIHSEKFLESQNKRIKKAEKQLKLIKQGKKAVNSLFGDDDNVKSDVNQSDVDVAIESVEKIKHKDIAKELMDRINKVKETLKEREQARVQEKKNKEREQKSQEKESTVEKEKKQEKEKTQQVGEAKEVEEDIVYKESETQQNADEIRRLEDRYYQLASQRDRLEYEAYQYPTHTQEHRDALEEIIKVLQEMQAIEEQLNQLY